MILTFEEIKANALKNYKPEPKVQFTPVKESNIERNLVIVGLSIATLILAFGIIL